ncbi:class I SAM-dependent methyltransferase [Conexibacter sp. SYSU D00693]|uniref:class I SAM-dependent methyltransferase n=1 Tax=Conexibacter sp. SYSU D00693 TaxID=2812560 RepID=UPI00196A7C57|nr:class I SAM-dependent methyltransferase [Conexibacter sp. SYSU D00693]
MPEDQRGCPACGGPLVPWRTVPSSDPSAPGPVALQRCGTCGTAVTTTPLPEQDLHETGAYSEDAPRGSRLAAPLLARFDRERLGLLARAVPPPARLVDAGAGRGRFAAAARAAGYDAHGIEPSRRGVDAALTHYGVLLERAGVEEATVAPGSADAVSLWHVLEHVDDPRAALRAIRGWLRPGGVLLVGVPDLASVQARIGGARWYHLDVPRHRTHFTTTGLRMLLRAEGFAVEAEAHWMLEHGPFGLWQSAVNRLTSTPSYLYNLLKRNAPFRVWDVAVTLAALPLVPVALVAEWLAGRSGRGGTVAMLARRAGD